MHVFFHIKGSKRRHESRQDAAEMPAQKALQLLNTVCSGGGFFGVLLEGTLVLQIYREDDGRVLLELLDTKKLEIESCYVTLPLAEVAVLAAGNSHDVKSALAEYALQWLHTKLNNADR